MCRDNWGLIHFFGLRMGFCQAQNVYNNAYGTYRR